MWLPTYDVAHAGRWLGSAASVGEPGLGCIYAPVHCLGFWVRPRKRYIIAGMRGWEKKSVEKAGQCPMEYSGLRS